MTKQGIIGRIRKLYTNMSAPVKASVWFTICNITQKGISLLSTPIFTRILTTEQYGVYSVYQSWYSIILILATLNLYSGVYNNGLTNYPEDRDRLTSSFQGLSTTVTISLFIIYLLNTEFWNNIFGLSSIFVFAMFAELLFVPAYSFWTVQQRYDYKYKGIVVVTAFLALGSPILGVISVLSTEYKAEARVLSYVLVQVIVGLVFYIYNFRKGKTFFSKKYWSFALKFNLPLIPHYLSMTVLNQSDRIMISNMIGSSEAAIYSVAYNIAMMMTVVTNAINNSFVPYTYKSIKEKHYDGIRRNSNFLLILVGGTCIIAMAFGPELIKIFASADYYDAIWVIPPVAASVYFMFLYPLFGNVEFYFEKTNFIMIASCCGAVANVVLNFIFIQIFGYYAAGYTTLACYILFSFAHYCFYKRILKEKIPEMNNLYDMRFVIGFSIVVLIAMVVMTMTYKTIVLRYGIVLVILIFAFIKRNEIIKKLREMRKK
ncbi:MAG: oligosaccharide flippase family protein [Tannerellaceae bacterium]|nr:oligosaccharide flippase family protein [Tannerellaceae bacterium]